MLISLWLPIALCTIGLFFASFGQVFQLVGTTAVLAHTAGGICREIWFTRPLRAKLMDVIDGVAYGVITGLIFALLWP